MPSLAQLRKWLQQHRSSARIAFLLQLGTRLGSSLLNLIWARLLVGAMGPALNGVFINFQAVVGFAGLGDLGMGHAVAFKTGQLLAERDHDKLQRFLAVARGMFMLLAVIGTAIFVLLASHLAAWLRFPNVPGVGSYTTLFMVGGIAFGLLVFSIYLNTVNYGAANVMWPVIPSFILLQLSLGTHWLLARLAAPLWMQYLPYAGVLLVNIVLAILYLRSSYPTLADLWPIAFDWSVVRPLLVNSAWLYFASVANVIYSTLARLLVMPLFGAALVPVYQYNFRLCELALLVISSAAFVSLPKIGQLIASPIAEERERASLELQRLSAFQTALGAVAAIVYLAINSTFVKWWLPDLSPAPMVWQAAFAASLMVATSGEAAIQGALRFGDRGIRLGGAAFGVSALLNLGSSFGFVALGWRDGIAWALPIAQLLLSLVAARFVCRELRLSLTRWVMRTSAGPLLIVFAAAAIRAYLPPTSAANSIILGVLFLVLAVVAVKAAGLSAAELRQEWLKMKSLLGLR